MRRRLPLSLALSPGLRSEATARQALVPHGARENLGCALAFRRTGAFTLLELIIVMAIIGLLAALSFPHLKGLTRSNVVNAANQQLLDDLALARQRAINNRTVVSVVFMPGLSGAAPGFLTATQKVRMAALQFTGYSIFAERSVGDQPGRPYRRYLTDWKTLPDGVFIATDKFTADYVMTNGAGQVKQVLTFDYKDFPFPTGDSANTMTMAYIAFDPQGHLVSIDSNGVTSPYRSTAGVCIIPLARGSLFLARDGGGVPTWSAADIQETGGGNSKDPSTYDQIEIDAITGRAQLDRKSL